MGNEQVYIDEPVVIDIINNVIDTKNRQALVCVSLQGMHNLLTSKVPLAASLEPPLPEDVELLALHTDFQSQCIEILARHWSFEEVKPGMLLPRIPSFLRFTTTEQPIDNTTNEEANEQI